MVFLLCSAGVSPAVRWAFRHRAGSASPRLPEERWIFSSCSTKLIASGGLCRYDNQGVQPISEAVLELESVIAGCTQKAGISDSVANISWRFLTKSLLKYLPFGASPQQTAELYASLRVKSWPWPVPVPRPGACLGNFYVAATARSCTTSRLHRQRKFRRARTCRCPLRPISTDNHSRRPAYSKLSSYTGRGSLEGWLRTVMAQEFVNRYRRQRRLGKP